MRYLIVTKRAIIAVVTIVLVICLGVYIATSVNKVALTNAVENRKIPIYSVDTDQKNIAVTFNAAWEADEVPEILEVLEKYDVKCTFFLLGEFVEKNPEEVKMILNAGHELANHSNSHPDMTMISEDRIRQEILSCEEKINNLTNNSGVKLFRAPSGSYNNNVINIAKSVGYQVIQWDVDSRDWMPKVTMDSLINFATSNNKPGSIILFHVGTKNGYTPKALPQILEKLKSDGYSFVKVSELIYPDTEDTYIDQAGVQHKK